MKSNPSQLPWCQAAGIFVAATVLGLAYNQASPLGVRAAKAAAASSVVSNKGFANETLSITLDSGGPTPAPPVPPAAVRQIPNLTWAQVQPLLAAGKVVLVDARAKATYDLGHIPGAVSLPSNSSAAEFQAFAKAHPPTTAVVSYCGSESCHASRQTLDALIRVGGFTQASDMPGGYAEFLASQAPAKP